MYVGYSELTKCLDRLDKICGKHPNVARAEEIRKDTIARINEIQYRTREATQTQYKNLHPDIA